ncbi:MAG: hypothetical protein PHX03_03545 [Bacilli bacterium]|nr:hypothetical protein [Bacilli bacterium]
MEEKETQIYLNSELLAYQIAGILNKDNKRLIDYNLVYELVKMQVKDKSIIDEVYNATISLLEDKYGILFDLDKNVDI